MLDPLSTAQIAMLERASQRGGSIETRSKTVEVLWRRGLVEREEQGSWPTGTRWLVTATENGRRAALDPPSARHMPAINA